MRMATWDRPGEEVLEQRLASQPTQSRLIDWLASPENREASRRLNPSETKRKAQRLS